VMPYELGLVEYLPANLQKNKIINHATLINVLKI
jgi:hypothetical protein